MSCEIGTARLMVNPLKECRACSRVFRGPRGWNYCEECSEDIRKQTVPAAQSEHPALVYEREHEPLEFTPPDPVHVMQCIAECEDNLAPYLETSEPTETEKLTLWTCPHEKFGPYGFCLGCNSYGAQVFEARRLMG